MLRSPLLGFVVGSSEALAILLCRRALSDYFYVIAVSQVLCVWLRVTSFDKVGIVEQVQDR